VAAESATVLLIVVFSSIVSRSVLYRFLLLEERHCDWVIAFLVSFYIALFMMSYLQILHALRWRLRLDPFMVLVAVASFL
jgi:hypothetical protein